ncbi:hypothetical protein TanjilG_05278 [Lupinus angustifolius]|uniref:Uncharacterized protein n=1 Tax=Lupinus angustifolius TaxID=3871 RepID=A0A4P1QVH7_LUPAN|nr:hypothetical protein TanjilG_05278 [Lupinus angustifolius]
MRFLLLLDPEGIRIPSLHSLHASFMKAGQGHRNWFPFLFSGSRNEDKVSGIPETVSFSFALNWNGCLPFLITSFAFEISCPPSFPSRWIV